MYAGGRTPAYAGGMTPGYEGFQGGRTPAYVWDAGSRTPRAYDGHDDDNAPGTPYAPMDHATPRDDYMHADTPQTPHGHIPDTPGFVGTPSTPGVYYVRMSSFLVLRRSPPCVGLVRDTRHPRVACARHAGVLPPHVRRPHARRAPDPRQLAVR